MTYQPGTRVLVDLPAGEMAGVVGGMYQPDLILVHVQTGFFTSILVGPHRLRPADEWDAPASSGKAQKDRPRLRGGRPVDLVATAGLPTP